MDDGEVTIVRTPLSYFRKSKLGQLYIHVSGPKYLGSLCVSLKKELLLDIVSNLFKQRFGHFSAFCKKKQRHQGSFSSTSWGAHN
jgi:hypothetical protein